MILGLCGNDGFTLLECTSLSSGGFSLGYPSNHTLNARRALRDGYLVQPDEKCFTKIEVEYDYLLAFAKSSTMEASVIIDGGRRGYQHAESKPFTPLLARWRGLSFRLDIKSSNFQPDYLDQNTRRLGAPSEP